MAEKRLSFSIFARNMVGRGIALAKREFLGLQRVVSGARGVLRGFGSAIGWVQRQFVRVAAAVGAAAAGLWTAVSKAFDFERLERQFSVLFGSMDRARQHMADLADFSASTPFQLEGIAEASRLLEIFSGGVLNTESGLRLVGDAAAVAGRDIGEVGMWVGRAYSAIQNGLPFGEAAMRLQEMGLLSGDARAELDRLTSSGASAAQVWATLRGSLESMSGGMQELSETGSGLVSTLKDNLNLALKDFGDVFVEGAKESIRGLIEWLQKLRTDGTLQAWAEQARDVLQMAAALGRALVSGGQARGQALQAIGDILIGALQRGAQIAVELLGRAAPIIGSAIGEAATAFMTNRAERSTARGIAATSVHFDVERRQAEGRPMTFREIEDAIDAETENVLAGIRAERMRQAQNRTAGALAGVFQTGDLSGQDRIDRGLETIAGLLEEQNRIAEEQAAAFEAAAGEREAARRAQEAEDQQQRENEQRALTERENRRMEESAAQIRDLWESPFAGQAQQNIAQRDPELLASINTVQGREAFATALAREIATLTERTARETQQREERLAAENEARQERLTDKRAALTERVRVFRQSQMDPAGQIREQERHLGSLRERLAGTSDAEERLDLQSIIQREMEKLVRLQTRATDQVTRRQLSVEDLFDRMAGTPGSRRSPEDQTAENTAAMVKLLQEINGQGGMTS